MTSGLTQITCVEHTTMLPAIGTITLTNTLNSFKRNTRLFMNNALDSAYIIQNALNEIEAAASQLRAYKKP